MRYLIIVGNLVFRSLIRIFAPPSGMSFVEKPPYFGCPSGRIGLLSSMFTDPDYRRKGIAKELLSRVVEEARVHGCGSVQITASDMGVLLYTAFGFVKNTNFMQYRID